MTATARAVDLRARAETDGPTRKCQVPRVVDCDGIWFCKARHASASLTRRAAGLRHTIREVFS